MTFLKEKDKAPSISVIIDGKSVNILDLYKGKKIIIYFYPKDSTPGCTAQACNLRDNFTELQEAGYEIIGISADNEKSHEKFKLKNSLPFLLISDTDKKIITDFGIWGEKKMFGKISFGIHRTTFVISEEGIIEQIITKVKTKEHTQQILSN